MKKTVVFVVEGKPMPKGRPRFNRSTGKPYTDSATKAYEEVVASSCRDWTGVFTGPVRVSITFHTKSRADMDNLIKSTLDGIQKAGVFKNDSQVQMLDSQFVRDGQEKTDVLIEDWKDPEWKGVYPGMCIDPETCRGYSHCPRQRSCCE